MRPSGRARSPCAATSMGSATTASCRASTAPRSRRCGAGSRSSSWSHRGSRSRTSSRTSRDRDLARAGRLQGRAGAVRTDLRAHRADLASLRAPPGPPAGGATGGRLGARRVDEDGGRRGVALQRHRGSRSWRISRRAGASGREPRQLDRPPRPARDGPLPAGAGALFLTRGDVASGARVLRAMLRAFERGVSVLNFPEGTTTPGAEVLPFHVGSFGAARIARVPVVPVALRYEPADLAWTGDAAFLPHYLKVASREASVLSLRICEPLHPIGSASDLELSRRARAAIQFALREL